MRAIRKARAHRFPAAPLMLLALLGCEPTATMPLARIDGAGPGVLEPGDVLVITGEGFVEGPATLAFDGVLTPSGAGDGTPARATLEALAVSGTRIELPVTGTVLSALSPEPATFRGAVAISFPTALAQSAVRVEARLGEVTLELRPGAGAVAAVARRVREAEAYLDGLGVSLAGTGPDAELLVEQVRRGSPADRAGLEPRDRLLAIDGRVLAGLADLAGVDPGAGHALSVLSAAGTPRELALIPEAATAWPRDEFAALMLTAVALGLFLAFAAPTRRGHPSAAGAETAHPLARALGLAALTVPMLVLPAVLLGGLSGPVVLLSLVGPTVAGAAGMALYGTGGVLSRVGSLSCGLLPLLAALAMAGVFGASIDLRELAAGQGSTPWGWHGWSNPFALAATLAATALIWPDAGRIDAPPAARIAAWITACGGAIALTACALGAWLLPGATFGGSAVRPPELIAGVAVFAAKVWLVLAAARWLAGAGRTERRGRAWRRAPARLPVAACLIGSLGMALAWDRAGLPAEIDTAGRVLASGVFATLVTALLARGLAGAAARRSPAGAAGTVSDPTAPPSAS